MGEEMVWFFLYSSHCLLIMTILNKINLTQDEETCILHFLRQAEECGYPSSNEQWYPVINSIFSKYYDKKYPHVSEAQHWQTL